MTAPAYRWIDLDTRHARAAWPAVEAGINDCVLDLKRTGSASFRSIDACPVIKLTTEEVVKQIQLVRCGLVGKGDAAAAAVLFV
jgi:hypothetical protein